MQQFFLMALTAVNALLVTLSQVALWQRKEYRLDRMMAYLTSPEGSWKQQRMAIFSGAFLALAYISIFAFSEMEVGLEILFALASLCTVFISHVVRIYHKGVMRPEFTTRAILVIGCTLVLGILLLPTTGLIEIYLATCIFFLPVLVAVAVYIIGIPAHMQKQSVVARARAYREHLQNLTVVGITGSVGKTSTKTYLIHLLGGESETIRATSEHRNSPYSVAQDMLHRLSQKTLFYIAEMGAYVQGEIQELAELTKPTIGIVTAITNQHAALFGSLEALARAKWELIEALPQDGVAILNKDDVQIVLQAREIQKKTVWFSTKTQADVYASDISLHQTHTTCTLSFAGEIHDITLPILSTGQLVPVLAAIAGATALHVEPSLIGTRLATLPRLPRTMELLAGINHATVVDDSYSASEASVTNAIEYLASLSSSDIRLVLVPIIELGIEGNDVHERIGKLLHNLSARVFIYGDAYKEDIVRGLGSNPKAVVAWLDDASILTAEVTKGITANTIVLLEGRIPSIVRRSLL